MDVSGAQAVLDRPPTEAQRAQLPVRDDPVLPSRQFRDLPVPKSTKSIMSIYCMLMMRRVGHGGDGGTA
jgi:hypothetical protein